MKKYISLLVAAVMMMGCLAACGSSAQESSDGASADASASAASADSSADASADTQDGDSLQIVTTIFPEYDWVMNVLGDNASNAEVTMLLDDGVDLHSYQPTVEDIMNISTCDVFIYVGGESDSWVDDALKESTNENMIVINLLDELGESVKEEELVEGMEGEEEEEAEDGESEEGEEEVEYDEHVWLSLKNSAALVECIGEALQTADSANADAYAANAAAYIEQLNALDAEYEAAVEAASQKTLLFGDRFPFRYLVDDYGLSYYAAFVGCSAETEASFETITFLAGKVDELSLGTVLTIENSDQKIAQTIIENTESKDQQILSMDSMQSTTAEDVANGVTYLSVMEDNLAVLKEALK
ncbi:MAG: metal ABC transporter substrate-binding protein [Eubacterium sp.]|nr:metal ABC transporter substrate-binding protein [Eubacterium sp.]